MKRDGNTVANALFSETLWTSGSASQASGLMKQIEFNPLLSERLKENPESVVADLKTIRKYCTFFLCCYVVAWDCELICGIIFSD